MIELSAKWAKDLVSQRETGMGYQIASIVLKNGKRFDQVVIVEGVITEICGREDIPFREDQITKIIVT
jgi:hypothetical protein